MYSIVLIQVHTCSGSEKCDFKIVAKDGLVTNFAGQSVTFSCTIFFNPFLPLLLHHRHLFSQHQYFHCISQFKTDMPVGFMISLGTIARRVLNKINIKRKWLICNVLFLVTCDWLFLDFHSLHRKKKQMMNLFCRDRK